MRLIDSFENDFVRIIISDKPIIEKMAHKDPAILFVLEGSAEVIISEKKWVLGANDYVSVNSDESYN
jgi:quercetin dioxygenase-like cupin family protein